MTKKVTLCYYYFFKKWYERVGTKMSGILNYLAKDVISGPFFLQILWSWVGMGLLVYNQPF